MSDERLTAIAGTNHLWQEIITQTRTLLQDMPLKIEAREDKAPIEERVGRIMTLLTAYELVKAGSTIPDAMNYFSSWDEAVRDVIRGGGLVDWNDNDRLTAY